MFDQKPKFAIDELAHGRIDHSMHADPNLGKSLDLSGALAILLINNVVRVSISGSETSTNLVVPCSDYFGVGGFGAISLPTDGIELLFRLWLLDNRFGPVAWITHATNELPNVMVLHLMEKRGWRLKNFWMGSTKDKIRAILNNTYDVDDDGLNAFYIPPKEETPVAE